MCAACEGISVEQDFRKRLVRRTANASNIYFDEKTRIDLIPTRKPPLYSFPTLPRVSRGYYNSLRCLPLVES